MKFNWEHFWDGLVLSVSATLIAWLIMYGLAVSKQVTECEKRGGTLVKSSGGDVCAKLEKV